MAEKYSHSENTHPNEPNRNFWQRIRLHAHLTWTNNTSDEWKKRSTISVVHETTSRATAKREKKKTWKKRQQQQQQQSLQYVFRAIVLSIVSFVAILMWFNTHETVNHWSQLILFLSVLSLFLVRFNGSTSSISSTSPTHPTRMVPSAACDALQSKHTSTVETIRLSQKFESQTKRFSSPCHRVAMAQSSFRYCFLACNDKFIKRNILLKNSKEKWKCWNWKSIKYECTENCVLFEFRCFFAKKKENLEQME